MSDELSVRFEELEVGRLRADLDGPFSFRYATTWLQRARRFPISLSLPLQEAPYDGGAAHTFFSNLLPEGDARRAVCSRLGISEANDVALLKAIGGEVAGALTVVDPAEPLAVPSDPTYERLTDRRLATIVADDDRVPLLLGGSTTRLSLAGAQDKVPVALLDGKIHLPRGRAPSTHILKLPPRRYPQLTVNEAFVMGFSAHLGHDVVPVQLVRATDPPCLLVERYDRRGGGEPLRVRRLHQEDLCQALAIPPARKYEREGGPSLPAVIDRVRSHVSKPLADVIRLVEWQVFNIVAGNSDGHGKNLSILHDDGELRLAPFYDLASTREYKQLDRMLAMRVGAERDPDKVGRKQWAALGASVGIGLATLVELARGVTEACLAAIEEWVRLFREECGAHAVLQTLPRAITRRARRVQKSLAA